MTKIPKVELTKVCYHNRHTFVSRIPTISETIDLYGPLKHTPGVYIKKNIFGHRWVLKLHEEPKIKKKMCTLNLLLYIFVTICIIVAFLVGVYIFFGMKITARKPPKTNKNDIKIIFTNTTNQEKTEKYQIDETVFSNVTKTISHCDKCATQEVCLQNPGELSPTCRRPKDDADPTGCGGLCLLEVQCCRLLDEVHNIRACLDVGSRPEPCLDPGQWMCREDFMCISIHKRCDGVIHCFDRSDEKDCDCNLNDNFRCGDNLSCIAKWKRCNGSVDCWDATDENNCSNKCSPEEFSCFDGQCLPKYEFCDGVYDCIDKSDEPNGCRNCTIHENRCKNGRCISKSEKCENKK